MSSNTTQKKIVLIIDEDFYFREVLSQCLKDHGCETILADNAEQAKRTIEMREIDIVLSEIQLSGESGIDLLKWTKSVKRELPVALMTGSKNLKEAEAALELGAMGFLPKPFVEKDLKALLGLTGRFPDTGSVKPDPIEVDPDDLYSRVAIEDFLSGKQIRFPVHLRIVQNGKAKYVKLAHEAEELTAQRIETFKLKGIHHLYLTKDDFSSYVGLAVTLTKAASGVTKIQKEKRIRLLKNTMNLVQSNFQDAPISNGGIALASTLVESGLSVFMGHPNGFDILESFRSQDEEAYAHCGAVSMLSILLGKALNWKSTPVLIRLGLSGMLHDIGKKELPKELVRKPRSALSQAEVTLLESHPRRGVEILSSLGNIPSDILLAVAQHHESCNGSGYPAHLRETKICAFGKIIRVADEFIKLYMPYPSHSEEAVRSVLAQLTLLYQDTLASDVLLALHQVFSLKVPDTFVERHKGSLRVG